MPASPEWKIVTVDDLPRTGLVYLSEFLSTTDERRLLPCTHLTWRRWIKRGEAPPVIKVFGRNAARVEHVRAIAMGKDWRTAELAE